MKSYYLLYLPALFFFSLPIINLLVKEHAAKRAQKAKEEQRRADAETRQVKAAVQQAARERAAEIKKAEKESAPRRQPGRPRKNPPVELPENILNIQDVEATAPVCSGIVPDRRQEKAAPLPTSCTLGQFAAWIK